MFEDFPDFQGPVEYYMDEGYTREEALQRLLDAHKTFELQPIAAPEWYGLPEIERVAA